LRFIARYFEHYLWLALAATTYAIVGWTILGVPLAQSPIAFGLTVGLAFSAPVNLLVVPIAYRLLDQLPARPTALRYIGMLTGLAWPHLCVQFWGGLVRDSLNTSWRGGDLTADFVLIPLMAFSALGGLWCAKFFNRYGDIASISEVMACWRSAPGKD
jgi:hypothetical protein